MTHRLVWSTLEILDIGFVISESLVKLISAAARAHTSLLESDNRKVVR